MRVTALTSLFIVIGMAVSAISTPALAAQCVNVIYKDKNGAVVPTDAPVIGLMLGGKPVMGLGYRPGVEEVVGDEAPCPKALVDKVQELFDASCSNEERRKVTAAASKVDIAHVNQRCGDMAEALLPGKR
jgi:hypothetical protein